MKESSETLVGFSLFELIHEGAKSLVYKAQRHTDQKKVVLKLLKSEYPSFAELMQFRNQYTIVQNLNLDGIVQIIALENYQNGYALVMEDVEGISLSEYLTSRTLNIKEFLTIALQIVRTLEGLYQHRIIHKDIKPQNIVIHPQTAEIKLIDFSISTLLPRETQEIQNPNVLEGTLAYMSPEQTGRMNRGIDYRTDFYSLGITFYEILTGQLPFQATDPMELVHCHIAKQPTLPQTINPDIPPLLSDIIMKLMAKTAENRYQSAFGLRDDLEQCLQQWQQQQHIISFPLGQRDISDRFQIPEKLYGRESEKATLLAAFERVSQGPSEMMLIAGFSGIGKTALINEVHKPIVQKRGYFIKGKFDQFKRNIPLSALVEAFENLIEQLLTESENQIIQWRIQLLNALGNNGQVMIQVIPELEQIIGPQPAVAQLPAIAAQNRFYLLFQKFIQVFLQAEHPLVIFVDDLQWADLSSLKLIQMLVSSIDTTYLLFIGAYRDNEVDLTHPLIQTLDDIRHTEITINQITLEPLDKSHLNHLITDTLLCATKQAIPFTELLFSKTQGNPFFTHQFLKAFHEEGLLKFDFDNHYWQWDIGQITEALALTDDVVEFMAQQLQKLPEPTQMLLNVAACIGHTFDLAILATASEQSQAEAATVLWSALQEGFIIPLNENYKLFQSAESAKPMTEVEIAQLSVAYQFLHDRVQQAAYTLIPENQKLITHLKIGRLLKKHTPDEALDENIFDIVNQFNHGKHLIVEQVEKNELAELNLMAGRKAKMSTAYCTAFGYFQKGLAFLATDSWQTQYELTLTFHIESAETAYLGGDFEQMEQLSNSVINHAHSLLDKIKVYEIKISAYVAQKRQLEAVNTALSVLQLLDIHFPKNPAPTDIQAALEATHAKLRGRSIETLSELPMMTDPHQLAAMRILSSIFSAAFFAAPMLLPLAILKQVNLSIEHGNDATSTFTYATYGLILCGVVGDIDNGYQFGQLALTLLTKLNAKAFKTRTFCVVYNNIKHWKEPVKDTLTAFSEAYQNGLETGDLEYAGYAALLYSHQSFLAGKSLTELETQMTAYSQVLGQLKQETPKNQLDIFRQATLNLSREVDNPTQLNGIAYNETTMLPQLMSQGSDHAAIHYAYLNKLILCYLFHDNVQAVENAIQAEQYLDGVPGTLFIAVFHFYDSLARLAIYSNQSEDEKQRILEKVAANQNKMKTWASYAPMNHQHKVDLVEAERYRVLGQYVEAMDAYERAITNAKQHEYPHEEALANELTGQFYIAWGKEKIAQLYLLEAYYGYARWGAEGKVADLETRYPQLLSSLQIQERISATINHLETTTAIPSSSTFASTNLSTSQVLDLNTVVKASQTISDQMVLEQLIQKMLQIVIENVGAQTGILILEQQGQFWIHAEAQAGLKECQIKWHSHSLEAAGKALLIPLSLVHTVLRVQKPIVLNDATQSMQFANDPYLIQKQPKSVLGMPILYHGNLIGALYLENNLVANAFTSDRLTVLKLLSTQIAISLENAQYATELEEKVKQRTMQLADANQEITKLNERLKADNLRMSAELDVARQLQLMVLPTQAELEQVEELDIAAFMEPADEVGGDYYDILQTPAGIKIGIGDVTGHGLQSGVLMLMVQMAVRTLLVSEISDPTRFLQILNQAIYDNIQRMNVDKNLTLSLLDYQQGKISLYGQHEEVLVVRQGGQVERIDTFDLGFMIGVVSDIADYTAQQPIELQPGDGIVLYTDGVTEARSPEKQLYGIERLCEVVSRYWYQSALEIQQAVIADVRQYISTQKVLDDITLLVIKQK